jgi:hypothetical protein
MTETGTYINSNSINYEHFANMKGTIYGNRLPRDTQGKDYLGDLGMGGRIILK